MPKTMEMGMMVCTLCCVRVKEEGDSSHLTFSVVTSFHIPDEDIFLFDSVYSLTAWFVSAGTGQCDVCANAPSSSSVRLFFFLLAD